MADCPHDTLREISTVTAETIWSREADGYHAPYTGFKVLGEDTEWFECADCGERVQPETAY